MYFAEKSSYKSWSDLKKRMQGLLCDSLKDRITYFYTTYHDFHGAYGRASIQFDKEEIVVFKWVEQWEQQRDVIEQYRKMDNVPTMMTDYEGAMAAYRTASEAALREKWMPGCILCEGDMVQSMTIYLKTNIAEALHSENFLLRIFACMDRRVGKRTLVKIREEMEALPEWASQFYHLRCEAEGIVFPEKP